MSGASGEGSEDPAAAASDVAQELLEQAGRVRDVEVRSALLAASRVVDQVIMENLTLQRRLDGIYGVLDGSLAVEMALFDAREAVQRVEALVTEWEADQGDLGQDTITIRRAGEMVRAALAEPKGEGGS